MGSFVGVTVCAAGWRSEKKSIENGCFPPSSFISILDSSAKSIMMPPGSNFDVFLR